MQVRQSLRFVMLGYVLCVTSAAGIAIYWLAANPLPEVPVWAPLLLPLVLIVFVAVRHVQRRMTLLTIASGRLRYETGLLSKSTRTMELVKVQDVRVDQNLFQRMAGIGDLSIETAGGSSRLTMSLIDRPQEVADHILGLAHAAAPAPGQLPGS